MNPAEIDCVLAFDVGGSHVSAGLCRLNDLQLIRTASGSLHDIATFPAFVDLLHRLGTEVAAPQQSIEQPNVFTIAGASLAVPGPFDLEAGISLMEHKLRYLHGKDLRAALASSFGWQPSRLRFLNDAAAYLLGEIGAGAAIGAQRAVGLTLGTGIGSAFAIHGRHVTRGEGVPPGGEIWNYPYEGGTVEDLISTRRIKADFTALAGPGARPDKEVAEIAALAHTDPQARQVFADFGIHLGRILRDVIAPFQPDIVVLGGGISRSASLFLPATEREIGGLGFRIAVSALLDKAPLVGAAHFWREETAEASARQSLSPSVP